jgi:peptidyl-prolyl cis-trans isomerase D
MITAMRRGATGWLAKILFVLLILSFGAWGIVDYLQPDPDPVVIRVGDTEVRQSWVRTQFSTAVERLRQRLGSTVTQDLALDMGLDQQVIDGIIDQQVMSREAQSLGMATTDSMLRSAIAQDPNFQGVTGSFDRGRYEQTLFRSGVNEGQYLQDLSGRLLRDPLMGAIVAAPPPPKPIVDTQYSFFGETRKVTILSKLHADLPAPSDPGEVALRAFHEKADQAYNLPELRDITTVVLNPEQIAKGFAVPEQQLKDEYENRLSQFRRPEERTVSQIVFQDADAAAKAAARLKAGESWVTVAGESGGVAAELGSVTKGAMIPNELAGPTFGLPEAGYTDPVQTAFGHHVLWVKAIDASETQPFEAVKEGLRQSIALDLAIDELIKRANLTEDTLAAGDSLEAAADAAQVPVQRFSGVSRTGQDATGNRPEGLPTSGQFLGVAFQTVEGETSILTESPDGGYFVLRVDRVIDSAKRPFEQVREQVLPDWIEAQRSGQAETAATKLAETLRAGTAPEEAASAAGFALANPEPLARSQTPAPTTPDLVDALFKAKKGEVLVHNDADRVFVVRVDDLIAPSMAADDEAAQERLEQLRRILDRDRRQEIARAFQQAVRSEYSVDVDKAAIDRVLR